MNVLVLAGGLSTERNVSLSSGAKVCAALTDLGHRAALVDLFLGLEDYEEPLDRLFENPPPLPSTHITGEAPDLDAVRASRRDPSKSVLGPGVLDACKKADVVFLGLHGSCGEDGRVQAALDLLGIPYTGSGYLGSAIAMDKNFAKRLVQAEDILTPQWRHIQVTPTNLPILMDSTPIPVVVKVPQGGSSIGVHLCRTQEDLRVALEEGLGQWLLLEDYIEGREFSCGVLADEALPPIEIIPKTGFYDYQNKYQPGATLEVCPAAISKKQDAAMRSIALRVHRLLGLSAYSRSDFIMDRSGRVYFLEVNTLPGMTPTSLIPQEAAAAGIDYPKLCQTLLDLALSERG